MNMKKCHWGGTHRRS